MEILINPRFAKIIPPLSVDEFTQLEANILSDGIRDPIVVAQYPSDDGELCEYIADGHNRYQIATKHRLEFITAVHEFESEDDVVIWIIDNQKGRRNLTDFVKFELAQVKAECLKRKGQEKYERTVGRPSKSLSTIDNDFQEPKHNTQKTIADDLGWSTGKVAMAQKVMNEAAEEIKDALRKSEISINQAYQEIKKPHVSNNSGENEWYTPKEYIDMAASVMGSIDLDPASSAAANAVIGAKKIFAIDDDGLSKSWFGNVWLNPPYSQPQINLFADKLVNEYIHARFEQAIVLVNNATETVWFQTMASTASALCFPKGRIKFWAPNKTTATPLQGQAFLYFGDKPEKFVSVFKQIGICYAR